MCYNVHIIAHYNVLLSPYSNDQMITGKIRLFNIIFLNWNNVLMFHGVGNNR